MTKNVVETMTGPNANTVWIRFGGLRIELSAEDYQALLAGIDADIANLHGKAKARERLSVERWRESREAAYGLRSVLYEEDEGSDFFLRKKPDDKALDEWIDKYSPMLGFA